MKTIGIDIGTTTISGVVYDIDGDCLISAKTIPGGRFIKPPHEYEKSQDVDSIILAAKGLLDGFLEKFNPKEIKAIGLTGQMHGILYIGKNGRSVSPLYTWQDQRGNLKDSDGLSTVELIFNEACKQNIITGDRKWDLPLASGYGLVTHIYNQNQGMVPKGASFISTVPDYFGMHLTGRKTPLMHIQMAGSLGLFSPKENIFYEDLLESLGVNTSIIPEVTVDVSPLGTYKGIPVMTALGDNQAAFIGSAGGKVGVTLLNMGTGGQVSLLSDSYFAGPGIEARPFLEGKFLLSGSSLCGGRAYAIWEKFVREIIKEAGVDTDSCYDILEKFGESGKDLEDIPTVKTTFSGTRVHPEENGSILNLKEENLTPGAVTYGFLKGMAMELWDFYETICKATSVETKELMGSGNGLRKNKLLRDIFSDLFNLPLVLSPYEEEAATGAAKTVK